jgi:hypothetical protein
MAYFQIDPNLVRFELPAALQQRLQTLLDAQDQGQILTVAERQEAEGLVEMSEFLSLLKLKVRRSEA